MDGIDALCMPRYGSDIKIIFLKNRDYPCAGHHYCPSGLKIRGIFS
jgi:hypothetical protein